MNYQVIVRNNATEQPIIKREYERRITHKDSIAIIEDVIITKIIKPKSEVTLDCESITLEEYVQHLMSTVKRQDIYKQALSKYRK